MYMDEHKQYSSIEAYEVAELAKEKGLTLLEGNYNESSSDSNNDSDCKGYCVTKMIAGQYFTLTDDSYIYQDHFYNGPTSCRTVWFRLTLEEAKKRIENFNGTFKNYPRFFAYIRVYKGEPEYYGFLQRLCLTEFAEKHGITYAEKFVCVGGQQSEVWHPCDSTGIDDVIDCCRKSFAKMDEDSYLVVSDLTRLNDDWDIWRNSYNIIPVYYEDMGYERYEYYESEKLRKRIREYEQYLEDREYEAMSQEYREMMLEQDEPFIELEGEQYEECSNEHD